MFRDRIFSCFKYYLVHVGCLYFFNFLVFMFDLLVYLQFKFVYDFKFSLILNEPNFIEIRCC